MTHNHNCPHNDDEEQTVVTDTAETTTHEVSPETMDILTDDSPDERRIDLGDGNTYDIGDASRRAADIVSQERDSHGDAYTNHRQIAALWTAILSPKLAGDAEIEPWLAAVMMQQVKQSRMVSGYLKFDHFADISGYSDVALYAALCDPDTAVDMDEL